MVRNNEFRNVRTVPRIQFSVLRNGQNILGRFKSRTSRGVGVKLNRRENQIE